VKQIVALADVWDMSRFRRSLGVVAVAVAALGGASSADAHTVATCQVSGTITANSTWIGNATSGPYTLQSTNTCTGVFDGVADIVTVNVSSSGTFTDIICGSESMGDPYAYATNATSASGNSHNAQLMQSADWGYTMVFDPTPFAGTWTFSESGNTLPPVPTASPTTTHPVGSGPVTITPWQSGQGGVFPGSPPAGLCTNGWNLNGVISFVLDGPDTLPNPTPGNVLAPTPEPPTSYPSSSCRYQGGSNAIGDGEHPFDSAHVWAHVWKATATTTYVCVRVQTTQGSVGGRVKIDSGSPVGTPVIEADHTDTDECTQVVDRSDTLGLIIAISPGSNPQSVCVTLGATSRRIAVGLGSSGPLPNVTWERDPDSLGP
jgi:hypothetical protein